MTRIARSPEVQATPETARAEQIALALLGVGALEGVTLAEAASWDLPQGAVTGRDAIQAHRATLTAPDWVEVTEIVTHGRAGSVTGRVQRAGEAPRLFCQVIRFTSPAAREIAQIVSFDHAG